MTDHVDNLQVFHGMHETVQQDGRASDDESKDETNNPELKPSIFQCILCSFSSLGGLNNIAKHMQRKHGFVKVKHSIKQEQSEDNNVVLQNQMTEGQMYKCISCGFKASEIKDLQIHEKIHKKIYSCPHCDYVAPRKQILESHITNHVEVDELGVFTCTFCKDFTSKLKSAIFKHMALKHKNLATIYECLKCSYATPYLHHLKSHWKVHRNLNTRYCCNICGFKTCSEKTFLHHCNDHIKQAERSEMEHLLVEEEEKQKKTESTVILQDELQDEITDKQIYKCTQCDFEASEFSALETHNTIHKDSYSCPHCDYVAGTKQLLEPHIINHVKVDELGMFTCTFCKDFTSKLKHAIFKHMALKHKNSAKIYECENCSYATPYSLCLKRHQNVHRNFNSYCCNICSFKTHLTKTFLDHCSKHIKLAERNRKKQVAVVTVQDEITEKQINKCIQCDFEASEFSTLETHKIIHMSKYCCYICGFDTFCESTLLNHFYNHIKEAERSEEERCVGEKC